MNEWTNERTNIQQPTNQPTNQPNKQTKRKKENNSKSRYVSDQISGEIVIENVVQIRNVNSTIHDIRGNQKLNLSAPERIQNLLAHRFVKTTTKEIKSNQIKSSLVHIPTHWKTMHSRHEKGYGCVIWLFKKSIRSRLTSSGASPSLLGFARPCFCFPDGPFSQFYASKPDQSATLWIQSSKNSPVFILFTKISAMLFCRTCDFSSCSCTNYNQRASPYQLGWNPSVFESSCARCTRECPAWSAGW